MKTIKRLLLLCLILIIFGCAENNIQDSIDTKKEKETPAILPKEIQQNNENTIAVKLISKRMGVEHEYKIPIYGGEYYLISTPFKKMLLMWAEMNFAKVDEESMNEIVVTIKDVNYDGGADNFLNSIYMKINIKGNIGDYFFDKDFRNSQSFTTSTQVNPQYKGSSLEVEAKSNIDRFLSYFVNSINIYMKEIGAIN